MSSSYASTIFVCCAALVSVSLAYPGRRPLTRSTFECVVPLTFGNDGMIGLVEIGTPGQQLAMRFDTTFAEVMVQSTLEDTVVGGGLQYNASSSTSASAEPEMSTVFFEDGEVMTYYAATETFDIGGSLFTEVPFGQLRHYFPSNGDSPMPFNGASGVFGLQHLASAERGFMYVIKDQLPDWLCTIDGYRQARNGTLRFGSVDRSDYSGNIAWVDQFGWNWVANLSIISAGQKTNPPNNSWAAVVATEDESLTWPKHLLDWYFQDINATWSSFDKTYRYPCNITLPDFVFGLGDGIFRVPGSYLPYQRDSSGRNCISIITANNSTDASYTFGLRWVQLGLLVLDYENYRLGFANKSTSLPAMNISSLEVVAFT